MMSPYDVTRLTSTSPLRGPGRETGEALSPKAQPEEGTAADKGVAVQTGARVSAGSTPVDGDRVAVIREALRDGSYPIVPARISDAMIAARLMLSSGQ